MDSIKDKIEKLLAMGQDSRTNPHEAETALRHAARLIAKHNIDVAELGARSGQAPKYDWTRATVAPDSSRPCSTLVTWFGQITLGVAQFTDTLSVWKRMEDFAMCVEFTGDRVDVETAVWLAEHLRDSIRAQAALYSGSRSEREDFRRAMVARLCKRMEVLVAERREELAKVHTATGTALMVVNDKLIQRAERFGEQTVKKHGRRFHSQQALEAGVKAGERVSLSRPVGSDTRRLGGAE